jgi:hypothetical protein
MIKIIRFISCCLLLTGFVSVSFADDPDCRELKGKVARALVTTGVENREPVDRVLILENDSRQVYFFSDLRHMQGERVTHHWEHDGKVMMQKSFDVKGPRWRVYSVIDMEPHMVGQWTVVITNRDGCPLKAVIFRYVEKGTEGPAIINLKK